MEKFNARMQQKIDTYENWSKATNFIPLKGELIIYTTDENGNEKIGFKVGTGEPGKNIHQLDFISFDKASEVINIAWDNVQNKPELYTKDEVYNKSEVDASLDTKVDKVTGSRLITNTEGTKLAGIAEKANNYILPAATISSLGGVKIGANLSVTEDGTISATSLDWNNIKNKPELYTKNEIYNKNEVDTSLNTKQDKSNLVTSIGANSTDGQYPSAKLLYTTTQQLNTAIQNISGIVSVERGGTGCSSIVDTTYTNARYRASSLHATETTPSGNGVIAWQYE